MPKKLDIDSLLGESTTEEKYVPSKPVPNVFPKVQMPYKIAIIGEAPGEEEALQGKPFVGYSGKELDRFLSRFGILRDACFVGNICQIRPQANKIAGFSWDGTEIQQGLNQLTRDLSQLHPNICLLLGGSALHAFKEPATIPRRKKGPDGLVFSFPNSIGDWRGSFFEAHLNSPCPGVKCIASYHPAACLRNYEWTPLLMLDISRCKAESTRPEMPQITEELLVDLSFEQTIDELDRILRDKPSIGTDIEGGLGWWACIGIATSANRAFIVPLGTRSGHSIWTEDQELEITYRLVQILADPQIVKIWQNGLYDRFILQYGYNIIVRGPSHDIMLKHWELYSELEKALAVQASIYTRTPYYKGDYHSDDLPTFHRYCCRDARLTKEIDEKLDTYSTFTDVMRGHYKFNITLLNALLYMEIRGINFDTSKALQRLKEIDYAIYSLQAKLDEITGHGIKTTDKILLRAYLRDHMCYKNDSSHVKKDYEEPFDICMRILMGDGPLTPQDKGRLATEMECSLNTKSNKVLAKYLYETLELPVQYNKTLQGTYTVTTDYEALITLIHHLKTDHKSIKHCNKPFCLQLLPYVVEIGELRTRASHLRSLLKCSSDFNNDGRVHTSYNEVGSETGRVTCGKFVDGKGYPMQTVEDENEIKDENSPLRLGLRDLLTADPDCYLAKCDLKGADGWTVGANLAALGNRTMLDDLMFGLKPANILCYARRHGVDSIRGKSRDQLRELCKEVKKSDWDYFAYKQCIWGFCYQMGVKKAVQHVFNLSEGSVLVTIEDMEQAKKMLFDRYHIDLWHKALEKKLFSQPYPPKIVSPSGHTRMFFGRRQEILGQALAHEPQSVTTYATNQAVYRCWTDPENRIAKTSLSQQCSSYGSHERILRIEPMHQVHDEFLCQFKISDTAWAVSKIKSWFANPIKIAGIEVTIPYDGAYGINWSMDSNAKKGSL